MGFLAVIGITILTFFGIHKQPNAHASIKAQEQVVISPIPTQAIASPTSSTEEPEHTPSVNADTQEEVTLSLHPSLPIKEHVSGNGDIHLHLGL